MAKWGEGDPRWIVEERPDATNVNNWHWTEKNAQNWSKDKLTSLLLNTQLITSVGEGNIHEIEKLEGDASANNRKGKLIVFYEWDVKLKYKGKIYQDDTELTGTITVPNLSDENTVDELDIQFTAGSSSTRDMKFKEGLLREALPILKNKFQEYIDALKLEFTQGMILPKKDGKTTAKENTVTKMSSGFNKCSINVSKSEAKQATTCQTLTTSTSLQCTAEDIYRALTNEYEFKIFTNGSGKIDGKVGGKFDMFDNNVFGEILELEPNKKIVQHWKFKTWKDFSKVTITIEQKESHTDVYVTQTGVPVDDLQKTKEGWERYYWEAIKRSLGFGSYIQ